VRIGAYGALSQELGKDVGGTGISARSRRSGRNLPGLLRLGPEGPKHAAEDEVTLYIE
jgi:hypothetical protein